MFTPILRAQIGPLNPNYDNDKAIVKTTWMVDDIAYYICYKIYYLNRLSEHSLQLVAPYN